VTWRKITFRILSEVDFEQRIRYNCSVFEEFADERFLKTHRIKYSFRFYDRDDLERLLGSNGYRIIDVALNDRINDLSICFK